MPEFYTSQDGRKLTTCPDHRREGYAFNGGRMVCRGCGEVAEVHETNGDTFARRQAEVAL